MYFKVVTAILIKIAVAVFVPTANATPNTDKIVKQPVIRVEQINLEGNTVFDSELEAIVAPLEQKELIPEQIFELRDKLTNYYLSQGYANSGAFLPQQNLTDGKITIVIIEGTLASIEIKGLSSLDEDYIKSRLPEIKKPLNKIKLSQSLARLQKNPLIDNITAEIVPHSIGKNTLLLEIEENNPITATLNLTDAYSPSIGNFGGNAGITHNNLLGFGDRLNLNRSQTEGLTRTGGFYSLPLNKFDSRITFEYNVADNEIIERELRDLEIKADYESFALNFSQPLIVTEDEEFILDIGIEKINSETFILEDLSFAFTEGLPDGETNITALRLSQRYVKNWSNALFTISSQFNIGIDAFDVTKAEAAIDGIFWSWQGDFQYLVFLDRGQDVVLATRLATQLTPDRLLPIEQFTVGGSDSVRGYRRNIGNADNGILGTIELQFLLVEGKLGSISVLPFFDIGTIWNHNRETTGSNTFASTGLALRYRFASAFEARVDFGVPLIETEGFGATETTDNLTFSLKITPLNF